MILIAFATQQRLALALSMEPPQTP
jgi:hypothetical protein